MDILTITFLAGSVLVLALDLYIHYQDKRAQKQ